jgi:CubicO group peptidase (beta-lactamase class C family)
MDSELLAKMVEYIQENDLSIHSVLVVRNGYMVAEVYFYPFRPDSIHWIASCTKSFTSALVGIAIEQGYIAGVDQPILDFFPDRNVANVDADKERMTLEHVLTMSSGLRCQDSYSYDWRGLDEMRASEDWVRHMLDLPMAEPPGTRFEYCNGGSYLLAAILQETTGETALDYARQHLFGPLGITQVEWPSSPQGVNLGWGEMQLRPRDMAKIGYLYLNGGFWDGSQVIPAGWVAASVGKHIEAERGLNYGYQWWIYPSLDAYTARGLGGQYIFVVPDLDMVVVFTSGFGESDFDKPELVLEFFILAAAKSSEPLSENPRAVARLESLSKEVGVRPEPEPVPPLPEMASSVSGKTYVLEDNVSGWQSFALDFQEQEAKITLSFGDDSQEFAVGLDKVFRISQVDQLGPISGPIALKGAWRGEDTFLLRMQFLNGSYGELQFRFVEGGVDVSVRDLMAGGSQRIRGTFQD